MFFHASQEARSIFGSGAQWRHAYGEPQPREAVKQASVWLLDDPGSVIPRQGKSVIATWGDPQLWQTLERIGIDLLHTGPIKRAGGIRERTYTPTICHLAGPPLFVGIYLHHPVMSQTCREQKYLQAHPENVKRLLESWFKAVAIPTDP
jgi:hypothetical protein